MKLLAAFLLCSALLGASEAQSSTGGWSCDRCNAYRNGTSPFKTGMGGNCNRVSIASLKFKLKWIKSMGGFTASPVVDRTGRLFVVDFVNQIVQTVDPANATLLHQTKLAGVSGGAVALDEVSRLFYVVSVDKYLVAVSMDTGRHRWKLTLKRPYSSSPVLRRVSKTSAVVFLTDEKFVSAVHVEDGSPGKFLWQREFTGVSAGPSLYKNFLYMNGDGLVAVDQELGIQLWVDHIKHGTDVLAAVSQDGHVSCPEGTEASACSRMAADVIGANTFGRLESGPSLDANFHAVFLPCENGRLVSIDAENGKQLWATRLNAKGFGTAAVAVSASGTVFVGGKGDQFHAVNGSTGKVLFSHTTGPVVNTPAIASDGTVYAATYDGALFAFTTF